MKIVSFSGLAVAVLALFVSTTIQATTNCSSIQKQILCVSYSDCNWVNGSCVNDKSSETRLDQSSSWSCSARSVGFDKHGYHYGSGSTEGAAQKDALATCKAFHVATDCEIDDCGQKTSANLQDSELLAATGGWEYLGCSVDNQQCAWRASNQNYSQHRSETSIYCPNASKMGCYGRN